MPLSVSAKTLLWSQATEILLPKNIFECYQLVHLEVGECQKRDAFCSARHLFMLLGFPACPMLPGSIHFSLLWSLSSI